MLKSTIIIAFLIYIGFWLISEADFTLDHCSSARNAAMRHDPDCARKKWGEEYYYVTRAIYDSEVLPYEIKAERFEPGLYTLKTSNNESINFKVTSRTPFYCGKVGRVLYNSVKRVKPIRILDG